MQNNILLLMNWEIIVINVCNCIYGQFMKLLFSFFFPISKMFRNIKEKFSFFVNNFYSSSIILEYWYNDTDQVHNTKSMIVWSLQRQQLTIKHSNLLRNQDILLSFSNQKESWRKILMIYFSWRVLQINFLLVTFFFKYFKAFRSILA